MGGLKSQTTGNIILAAFLKSASLQMIVLSGGIKELALFPSSLKGQYHAIFSDTLKIEKMLLG